MQGNAQPAAPCHTATNPPAQATWTVFNHCQTVRHLDSPCRPVCATPAPAAPCSSSPTGPRSLAGRRVPAAPRSPRRGASRGLQAGAEAFFTSVCQQPAHLSVSQRLPTAGYYCSETPKEMRRAGAAAAPEGQALPHKTSPASWGSSLTSPAASLGLSFWGSALAGLARLAAAPAPLPPAPIKPVGLLSVAPGNCTPAVIQGNGRLGLRRAASSPARAAPAPALRLGLRCCAACCCASLKRCCSTPSGRPCRQGPEGANGALVQGPSQQCSTPAACHS